MKLITCLAAVFGLTFAALADVAPSPNNGRRPGPRLPQVAMRSADVKIQFSQVDKSPKQIQAQVECEFSMECISAQRPGNYAVTFPMWKTGGTEPTLQSFAAEVDGQPVKEPRKQEIPFVFGDKVVKTVAQSWFVPVKQGDKQTIKVKYTLLLPVENDAASFQYILRSGAQWTGKIEKETVTLKAAEGMGVKVEASGLKPNALQARQIVWKIENTAPESDIEVTVTLPNAAASK